MKISLGQHETATGKVVNAWIEPNYPAYRSGAVRDNGFLCVEEAQPDPSDKMPIKLRLESMSEEGWKLQSTVGATLMRQLWEERKKYDRSPYYMAVPLAQQEPIYFEPWAVIGGEPSVAFHTRPDGRYPSEGMVIPEEKAQEQLQAFFTHQKLQTLAGVIPDTYELADALRHGRGMANAVMAVRAEYAALVDWDFDKRVSNLMMIGTGRTPLTDPNDIERYEQLATWAQRPDRHESETDTAEFHRWFNDGGKPRLEPLTSEQLAAYLLDKGGHSPIQAEHAGEMESVATSDWDWFKDKRLGRMREPVETLLSLIQYEEMQPMPDSHWVTNATKSGDYCAPQYVSPAKVYSAINEFAETMQRNSVPANEQGMREANGQELANLSQNTAYRAALAALKIMRDPANGLAIEQAHPVNRNLGVFQAMRDNNVARANAISEGGAHAAAEFKVRHEQLLATNHAIEAEIGNTQDTAPNSDPHPEIESEHDSDNSFSP
jgi:hypothetical protein